MAAESSVTHRRRYRGYVRAAGVLELLLTDPDNPRSLAFSLARLRFHLAQLAGSTGSTRPERLLEHLEDAIEGVDIATLTAPVDGRRPNLEAFLAETHAQLHRLGDAIVHLHFEGGPPPQPLSALTAHRGVGGRLVRYRVSHRTTYSYDDDVSRQLRHRPLRPRELPWQQVASRTVSIDPAPGDITDDIDCYGNVVSYFQVTEPHVRLTIDALSEVAVVPTEYDADALLEPWERARPILNPGISRGAWAATEFALESPKARHVDAARDYAAASLVAGRPIGEAVTDLMHRIKTDFDYDQTATTVTSTVADVMAKRAGVCQDFAHLALACLRSHGLAARYVSGYLATRRRPASRGSSAPTHRTRGSRPGSPARISGWPSTRRTTSGPRTAT